MWNGKKKALTFSFDDGVMQDRRLVEILKKYGLKGTFNLNSGMMYHECVWNTGGVDVIRLNHDECLELFGDFEPAVHTLTHPDLLSEGDYMRERQIAGDKANLERLFGRKADKKRKIYNGKLECNFYSMLAEPPKKQSSVEPPEKQSFVAPPKKQSFVASKRATTGNETESETEN